MVDYYHCKPLALLFALPFAFIALFLSLLGALIWLIGSLLSCLCPCCFCCAGIGRVAINMVKLPNKIIIWFIQKIPC
uniref:Uncharacterized protein n=1 Tax=Solanum lycopersicum TaxID=4081 RepID=K4CGW3_SOLLC